MAMHDRLNDIKQEWVARWTIPVKATCETRPLVWKHADVAWLVGEVERLYRALEAAHEILSDELY